jgi:hypothetical protein
MQISTFHDSGASTPSALRAVYLELSIDEASELASALVSMVDSDVRGPDSHYHLVDGCGNEVTVWLTASA